MLKYTEILKKDLSRYKYLDTSIERDKYFRNTLKSIEKIESILHKNGFSKMFIEQSPFSFSCYFTFNKYKEGKIFSSVTLRISDHENPNGIDCTVADEYISRFGYFFLNKCNIKEYERIGLVN